MKEKFLNAMKSAWSKTVSWVKDKAVPWLKDKVVPALKKAWDFLKQKGKELLQAIPPTVSRIIRTVEGWLNSALGHISGKMAEKNGDEPKKQRVSRPLLFLVLIAMCAVVIAGFILTIVFSARFFSCVCHPLNRGNDPVEMTGTAAPETPPPTPGPTPTINPDDTYLGGAVFQKGDDDETIAVVQQRLMDLGYMDSDEPTEHFGSITLEALKQFQKRNGLEENGILDESSYALMFSDSAKEFVLQIGDEGDDVEEIQERLYELGYLDKDSRTGKFGDKTEEAVIAFQTANSLRADGLVGTQTKEQLFSDEVIGNVFKSGDKDDTIVSYQNRLIELGYLASDYQATGNMDTKTVSAIKSFQEANGLVKDGVLGPTTMSQLNSKDALKYALRLGMSGSKVKDMQKLLKQLGYLTSSQVTGYFGEETEEAVKLFQKRNGLSQDGAVGSKTLEKLNSSSAKRAPATATAKPTKKPATAKPKATATPKPGTKKTPTPKPGTKTAKPTAKPTATPKPTSNSSSKVEKLISIAESKLGCPYVRGAKGPNRFDCSGFVYWCLNKAGVKQGYMTSISWRTCSKYKRITEWGAFKRGDIMVFKGSSMSVGHVGIYLGNGKMIDASSGAGQVRITKTILSGSYWKQHFLMAYRIWD